MRGLLDLLGRAAFVAIFLASSANKILNFDDTVAYMTKEGVPEPRYLLMGAIAFLILGSLLVLFGLKTRLGALMLLTFLAAATYYFHDFWNMPEASPDKVQGEQIQFMKNLALAGATLMLVARGSGRWSLDAKKRHASDAA